MNAGAMWIYPSVITAMWLAWVVFWLVSASSAKVTARVESAQSRLLHLVPLLAGIFLIEQSPVAPWRVLSMHALPGTLATYWCGATLQAAGLLFTVWARLRLGRNWSGIVTLKQGHELIRTGPYRWVRHPIYTGLLVAFLGNAICANAVGSFIGVAICGAAFVRKLRIEEGFLRTQFGEEYSLYAAETRALLPLLY